MSGRFRTSSIALPRYMLVTVPQKSSGFFSIIMGPGVIPWIISAPSRMPMTALAGMPSVSSGMKAACAAALLAASGAATPAIAPWPNCSGVLEMRFSMPYAINEASTAPPPGRMPSRKPENDPRMMGMNDWRQSSRLGSRFLTCVTTTPCLMVRSTFRRISEMPNRPMASGAMPMPSRRSGIPIVKRGNPVMVSSPTTPAMMPTPAIISDFAIDFCAR